MQLTQTARIRMVIDFTQNLTERHSVNEFVDLAADAGILVISVILGCV